MTTEEYSVGYNEGYQEGWNAAQTEADSLRAEADWRLADAERFSFISKTNWYVGPEFSCDEAGGCFGYENHNTGLLDLRKAIDAAIAAGKQS